MYPLASSIGGKGSAIFYTTFVLYFYTENKMKIERYL